MRTQLAKWIVNVLKHLKGEGQAGLFIGEINVSTMSALSELKESADFSQYDFKFKKRVAAGRCTHYLIAEGECESGKVAFKCTLAASKAESKKTNPVLGHDQKKNTHEGQSVRDAHAVSKTKIDAYIQYSSDDNFIHQGPRAVVPALVIIDEVLSQDKMLIKGSSIKFRFKNALLVDELWVYDMQSRCGKRGDTILFTVQTK